MKKFKTQSGNALFLILIAIALLGLLTVTMTRSGSSTNDTGSYEQNQIAASEILTYAKGIENAVQSLLARDCSENDLSFWHDSDANGTEDASDDYYNAGSPTDHSCHVFDVAGAGMTYLTVDSNLLDSSQSSNTYYGHYSFWGESYVEEVETTKNDLTINIGGLKKEVCLSINKILKIQEDSNDAPSDTVGSTVDQVFIGSYSTSSGDPLGNDANSFLSGRYSGCLKRTDASNLYHFYHVLHAR